MFKTIRQWLCAHGLHFWWNYFGHTSTHNIYVCSSCKKKESVPISEEWQ